MSAVRVSGKQVFTGSRAKDEATEADAQFPDRSQMTWDEGRAWLASIGLDADDPFRNPQHVRAWVVSGGARWFGSETELPTGAELRRLRQALGKQTVFLAALLKVPTGVVEMIEAGEGSVTVEGLHEPPEVGEREVLALFSLMRWMEQHLAKKPPAPSDEDEADEIQALRDRLTRLEEQQPEQSPGGTTDGA